MLKIHARLTDSHHRRPHPSAAPPRIPAPLEMGLADRVRTHTRCQIGKHDIDDKMISAEHPPEPRAHVTVSHSRPQPTCRFQLVLPLPNPCCLSPNTSNLGMSLAPRPPVTPRISSAESPWPTRDIVRTSRAACAETSVSIAFAKTRMILLPGSGHSARSTPCAP